MKNSLWIPTPIGDETFQFMNLDHPSVEQRIMEEMAAGVDVYYDRRWSTTEVLTDWLSECIEIFAGKRILVLGAGVGAETLILGRHAEMLWINDLAPVALELCREQLAANDITSVETLLGNYQDIALPEVDLIVGSFLVYNKDTLAAMEDFLTSRSCRFLLVNEQLKEFKTLRKRHSHTHAFEHEYTVAALFEDVR